MKHDLTKKQFKSLTMWKRSTRYHFTKALTQNKTISKFGIWLTMILSEKKKYGLQENKNKIS